MRLLGVFRVRRAKVFYTMIHFDITTASDKDCEWPPAFIDGIEEVLTIIERTLRTLDRLRCKDYELSLLLTNDIAIQALNRQYRGFDKPTNVLSFAQPTLPLASQEGGEKSAPDDSMSILGDVALSYDTIKREAHAQDKAFESHALHLFVHGVLHLAGYTHEQERDARIMESLEVDILRQCHQPNPYGDISTEPSHSLPSPPPSIDCKKTKA